MRARLLINKTDKDIRAALLLILLAAAAGATVAFTHLLTRDQTAANVRERELAAITSILGEALYDNDPLTDQIPTQALDSEMPDVVYPARGSGRLSGAVFGVTSPTGYVAPIRMLVGVDPGGKITGIGLVSHSETPGLGDRIEPRKSDWLNSLNQRSLDDPPENRWELKSDGGDFDAISGASVTSRAVLAGAKNALLYFRANQEQLKQIPDQASEGTP